MAHYRVSADWLEIFLQDAIDEGQAHLDWINADMPHLCASASAAAWLRALSTRRAGQAILRMAENSAPGRIIYRDPKEDKRGVGRQCHWLISWLFARISYEHIQLTSGVANWQIVERTIKRFARTIGLRLAWQRGRRDGGKVHT